MSDPATNGHPTPPFSPELIADLHASALPAATDDALWPLARGDADAAAVLHALDETAAELSTVGGGDEPMPELVAARLRRALLAAPPASPLSATTPSATAETPRSTARLGIAAAAAVVLGMGAFIGFDHLGPAPDGAAQRPIMAAPIEVPDGAIPLTAIRAARHAKPGGRLADPTLLSDCLGANGYAASTALLGSAPARVGERPGTLLLIPGDRPPLVIALVVGDQCSASDPDLLAVNTVTD